MHDFFQKIGGGNIVAFFCLSLRQRTLKNFQLMKKILLLTLLLAGTVFTSQARLRIPVGQHQKTRLVLELPDSAYYQSEMGNYVDLGYTYTVYLIAGIPVWTTDKGGLVGYTEAEPDTNYLLDEEMLEWIREDTGIEDLSVYQKMPFWDKWGGKLLALLLIGCYLLYRRFSGSDDDDDAEPAAGEEPKPAE